MRKTGSVNAEALSPHREVYLAEDAFLETYPIKQRFLVLAEVSMLKITRTAWFLNPRYITFKDGGIKKKRNEVIQN